MGGEEGEGSDARADDGDDESIGDDGRVDPRECRGEADEDLGDDLIEKKDGVGRTPGPRKKKPELRHGDPETEKTK